MGKVIEFRRKDEGETGAASAPELCPVPAPSAYSPGRARTWTIRRAGGVLGAIAWTIFMLCWPFLRWIIALEVAFQFVRMFFRWGTLGIFAVVPFVTHYAIFIALTYFVTFYQPEFMRRQ